MGTQCQVPIVSIIRTISRYLGVYCELPCVHECPGLMLMQETR